MLPLRSMKSRYSISPWLGVGLGSGLGLGLGLRLGLGLGLEEGSRNIYAYMHTYMHIHLVVLVGLESKVVTPHLVARLVGVGVGVRARARARAGAGAGLGLGLGLGLEFGLGLGLGLGLDVASPTRLSSRMTGTVSPTPHSRLHRHCCEVRVPPQLVRRTVLTSGSLQS